jgi:hypothetical protein
MMWKQVQWPSVAESGPPAEIGGQDREGNWMSDISHRANVRSASSCAVSPVPSVLPESISMGQFSHAVWESARTQMSDPATSLPLWVYSEMGWVIKENDS